MSRREKRELGAGIAVLAVLWLVTRFAVSAATRRFYVGLPDGALWSNLAASAACALLVWWRLRIQAVHHHVQQMLLASKHHADQADQAERHHRAHLELTRRNQQQLLDQAAGHHQALKAHITAAAGDRA